jgi:DNA-binding transcriptional ArsR family regulator
MSPAAAPLPAIECVQDPPRAAVLLNPLRLEILARARTPRSASEIAALLGSSRQKVNYHVGELFRAGFLAKAGRRKRRNMYEQRYRATASSYLLSPDVLGPVFADLRSIDDRMSVAYLLALSAELQRDLGRATREAAEQRKRLATLSIRADLRFQDPAQRERFAEALQDAIAGVVREHASAERARDGSAGAGRPYRLMVGCYPIPPDSHPVSNEGTDDDEEA